MTTAKPVKAKRKLSELTFEHENAHVALVSKEQGHGANGHHYALVMKAKGFSQEAIQKMQSVQVTLELPEFLRKFFDLYHTDAEVLARFMGYVPEENEDDDDVYGTEAYYAERLGAFTIMKSLHESGDVLKALALLDENEYLSLLTAQVEVEKALAKIDAEKESDTAALVVESDNSTNASVEKSVEPSGSKVTKSKKENMTLKTKQGEEPTVEMVEKSALDSIQKALNDKDVELQKALADVAAFKEAQQEQIIKSKTAQITAVVTDANLQAVIVKAALALELEDDFTAFVGALSSMQKTLKDTKDFVEKSTLFEEVGASTSTDALQESPVARILKSRLTNAK